MLKYDRKSSFKQGIGKSQDVQEKKETKEQNKTRVSYPMAPISI